MASRITHYDALGGWEYQCYKLLFQKREQGCGNEYLTILISTKVVYQYLLKI